MLAVRMVAIALGLIATVIALGLMVWAIVRMIRIIQLGAADPTRRNLPQQRWLTMFRETIGHTRMLKWKLVGATHWFVFVGFGALVLTLIEAYGELFDPEFELPLIGGWAPYGLAMEAIAALTGISIAALIVIRLWNHPRRVMTKSRFSGSTMWQGYFVEWVIVAIITCIFAIRGFKVAIDQFDYPQWATPISYWVGDALPSWTNGITVFAAIKVLVSMAWFIVIALNITMGVAWHRFTAFPNIWFKRDASGKQALGALRPMMSNGKPLDFAEADPEKDTFGVGQVEQFSWKGLLDFTTCTECGRCQSQCPAWNTAKPLSPKLLVLDLRDHVYAKAPYLQAGGGKTPSGEEQMLPSLLAKLPTSAVAEADRPLVGDEASGGVIDPDVLWSCTTCGACVEQCPVDIEHVDHIMDMRRHQVLIEADFPAEGAAMLRNLETKGNPWGANPNTREDWTKGLPFPVSIIPPGRHIGDDIEYLFWVGCAGAFDDRAKKTTRAVAELLHTAGVNFAILGKSETCTGDPARRMGNEFVFQTLASQNVDTIDAAFANRPNKISRTIVATCPHCFNTLANEYPQLGGEYEVVHHTQLLARLVAERRLVPMQQVQQNLTYHDPCYLGRHNRVFSPPRELIGAVGASFAEMPRNSERSFCCGAGGARMWLEEKVGKRINIERTEEALTLQPDAVVAACPFCATMLGDGVTAKKSEGAAPDHVEVLDIAQVLHRSVGLGTSDGR